MEAIKEFRGEHRFLSNFWPCSIIWGQLVFPSTENAYQASKSLEFSRRRLFTHISPGNAKSLARKMPIRDGFHDEKLDIMWDINWQKYRDPILREKLLATGDCQIIEGNTWGDTFWGVCDGKGENNLGKILMDIRSLTKTL